MYFSSAPWTIQICNIDQGTGPFLDWTTSNCSSGNVFLTAPNRHSFLHMYSKKEDLGIKKNTYMGFLYLQSQWYISVCLNSFRFDLVIPIQISSFWHVLRSMHIVYILRMLLISEYQRTTMLIKSLYIFKSCKGTHTWKKWKNWVFCFVFFPSSWLSHDPCAWFEI